MRGDRGAAPRSQDGYFQRVAAATKEQPRTPKVRAVARTTGQSHGLGGGEDEEAPEGEQGVPVRAPGVGSGYQAGVAGLELAALRLLQGVEELREPGALQPLLHRVLAGEDVDVRRLPDVDRRRAGGQEVVVE